MARPIVLFGGTFDPIHNGHLSLCQAAYRQLYPEKILLIPSAQPPHKQSISDSRHRLAMCRLAAEQFPFIAVDGCELERCEMNYSIYTALEMAAHYPTHRRYWLMGMDAWFTLSSWYRWQEFCDCVIPLVAGRNSYSSTRVETYARFMAQHGVYPTFLDWTPEEVSSSSVRALLSQDRGAHLLPPTVLAYIREYGLYASNG